MVLQFVNLVFVIKMLENKLTIFFIYFKDYNDIFHMLYNIVTYYIRTKIES